MCTKPQRSVSRCFIAFSLTWKRPFYSDCFFVAIERGLWARWIIGFLFLTLLNLQFLKERCWSVVSSMLRFKIPNKMWTHIYRFIHLLDTGQNVQWSLNRCWLFLRSERESRAAFTSKTNRTKGRESAWVGGGRARVFFFCSFSPSF